MNHPIKEYHLHESIYPDGKYRPACILTGKDVLIDVTENHLLMTIDLGKIEDTGSIAKFKVILPSSDSSSAKLEIDSVSFTKLRVVTQLW